MHMSPGPSQAPIVACQPGALAGELWRILAPESWPVPLEALPKGSVLVGGAVRDALLGRLAARPDLDLVVPEDAVDLARKLARRLGGAVVVLDQERSMARLVLQGWTIDLARRMGADLPHDLLRRDYSANAIALPLPAPRNRSSAEPALNGDLLDPSGGLADLAAGQLRAISEANLLDDPLRLLRGVRLACELGFRLEATTEAWIRQHHPRLQTVAGERILAELERMAAAPDGAAGLALAVETRLLEGWRGGKAPQETASPPGNGGPLASLGRLSPEQAAARGLSPAETERALPLARLAAVLDGEGLERLHASRRRQQAVKRLRQWWERLRVLGGDPERLPEQERVLLQRQLEEDLPALALMLDATWARNALPRWRDPADPLFHPRPPIDGTALQSHLNLKPGPELGKLLEHLTQERAFGRLPIQAASNDPETLTVARHWLSRGGVPRHG